MSRYLGPRLKKMRSFGTDLPGLSRKSIERRPFPPGQHGPRMRRKMSEYGKQLVEKQKLRLNYGVGERQMRRYMVEARRSKLAADVKLVELLERRLDNVVFRAGLAPTIPAARQLVNHGHFLVNGRRVNIPSYQARVGDVISVRNKSMELAPIVEALDNQQLALPDWLVVDRSKKSVTLSSLPGPDSVPFPIELQLVVEYYAQRL